MLKETIRGIVKSQVESLKFKELGIRREKLATINTKLSHALIISGIRRCGKSTLLKQLMKDIKKPSYFSFEDPRTSNFQLSDFGLLEEIFKEEYDTEFYFFDEIQNVKEWERYVRKFVDEKQKTIITGSNASLLSKELGTKLTGRHITYELFPFSFREFLDFKKEKASVNSLIEYMKKGGFPEYLRDNDIQLLHELVNDILARDIIIRNNLKEDKSIRSLLLYLLSNIGKEFSYNKLSNSLDIGSINTIISYISYLEDCYILFIISKIDYSYKKQLVNPKKVYCIDLGLLNTSANINKNDGMQLENLIFIHLRMKYKDIYYHKKHKECDFIIREKNKPIMAIQVCYKLTEENQNREIEGLKEAMNEFNIPKGLIITLDQEDMVDNIKVTPAWKWLEEMK